MKHTKVKFLNFKDKEKSYHFMEIKDTPKGKQVRLAPGVFSTTQKANGQWITACHVFKLEFLFIVVQVHLSPKLEFCSQLNIVKEHKEL